MGDDDGQRRKIWRRRAGGALAIAGLAAAAWAVRDIPAALGRRPTGERARRLGQSPNYRDGVFQNPLATSTVPVNNARRVVREFLFGGKRRRPTGEIPLMSPSGEAGDGLHITWYGHASALVELDGHRVLIDPVWSERCSPSRLVGPRRLHRPPVPLDSLPYLDAILISHDHYDHLDMGTVQELVRSQDAVFVVPLGVGEHLDRWGVPPSRIAELDWHESVAAGALTLTAAPARHFSGRAFTRNTSQWSSWVIAGESGRVFYTGDSGYFPGYADIGERYGPFDAALVQTGAYDPAWPDIHMFPEEAISAHQAVRGGLLIPVHWATFDLALHTWADPADRLWREAKERGVPLCVPRPGQRVRVSEPPPVDGWWQLLARYPNSTVAID
jgi:L-ascorbate metabolism protein UlaG (beta-lactamase superfamily)